MIEVRDLTKFYGGKAAVDHLTFTVKPGQQLLAGRTAREEYLGQFERRNSGPVSCRP